MSDIIISRAHPDLNQGPADLQSAALTTELCTHWIMSWVEISKIIDKSQYKQLENMQKRPERLDCCSQLQKSVLIHEKLKEVD